MIAESLAAFINSLIGLNVQGFGAGGFGDVPYAGDVGLQSLGINGAFVMTPDLALGELTAPYFLIDYLQEGPQELWAIGDAFRKENPIMTVQFVGTSHVQRRDVMVRFRRAIEMAKALDNGIFHPGIDFLAAADLLRNYGDNLTYLSDQPWTNDVAPTIYKNRDSNGEPIVIASGFSVDAASGVVTFTAANSTSDEIRATYKIGVIDFNIRAVDQVGHAVDVAENPARYLGIFDLETHYYIKSTSNRWL